MYDKIYVSVCVNTIACLHKIVEKLTDTYFVNSSNLNSTPRKSSTVLRKKYQSVQNLQGI